MSNLPVDRDENYMREMWGTDRLASDYGSMKQIDVYNEKRKFIQEIMDYENQNPHDLKKQTNLHEKIRNDQDYDDWEYGTEPSYGQPWQ